MTTQSQPAFRRIATEEAFSTLEQMEAMREVMNVHSGYHPDFPVWRMIVESEMEAAKVVRGRLLDIGEGRVRIMDEHGVAVHLLSLTSTGVQMLEPAKAVTVAKQCNDLLAAAVQRYPTRFAGLATVPPQAPAEAVKEVERAIGELKLNGLVINSHTDGEFLCEEKYWPILEAAEAMEAAIYLHPRAPNPLMAEAYRTDGLEHAIWGYQAETGLHALRLITGGVFDRFPKLKIVLGHMGEGIPYWLYRIDYMHALTMEARQRRELNRKPSEYFRDNFMITTSGMNDAKVLKYCIDQLSADNIMFAIDYPYQLTEDAVGFLDEADISHEDKEKIYHLNAERIFKIPGA